MGHEKRQNLATSSLFSRDKGPIKTQPVSMAPRGCVCPRYRRFSLRHRLTRVSGALSCKNPRRYASDALVHASVLDQVATNLESSGVSGPLGCVSPHSRRLSLVGSIHKGIEGTVLDDMPRATPESCHLWCSLLVQVANDTHKGAFWICQPSLPPSQPRRSTH